MAELKYSPVRHDHKAFLERARARKGFTQAYDALELAWLSGTVARVAEELGMSAPANNFIRAALTLHAAGGA
jgi:hypothetical protein